MLLASSSSNNSSLPAKVQKQTRNDLAQVARAGIVNVAHIQATAFVTNVALTQTAMLSAQEAAMAAQDPIAAARYESIVNDFVFVARNTIRRMGQ
jgi:hypothetical protein